ncbi:MAG: GYD domain-containing protein [Chloroflexota bacterium]
MATYIILTRVSPDAFREPGAFKEVAQDVSARIKSECPGVVWKDSYSTLGSWDVVDIVEAERPQDVQRAVMIIRGHGHSTTETMLATPWKEFLARL